MEMSKFMVDIICHAELSSASIFNFDNYFKWMNGP